MNNAKYLLTDNFEDWQNNPNCPDYIITVWTLTRDKWYWFRTWKKMTSHYIPITHIPYFTTKEIRESLISRNKYGSCDIIDETSPYFQSIRKHVTAVDLARQSIYHNARKVSNQLNMAATSDIKLIGLKIQIDSEIIKRNL